MLNVDTFKSGMEELILAFGLDFKPETLKLWYKYCKDFTDMEFRKKVRNCIMYCRKKPYIADLINPPQSDNCFEPANAGAYEIFNE